jgi:urease accessory protein
MNSAAPALHAHPLNRAQGHLRAAVKATPRGTGLATLFQRGSMKAVFPRSARKTLVQVNTAGGVTGGDRFQTAIDVQSGSHLTVTTQAAERAYRARPGETGRVSTELTVANGASLHWLPQETIVFDEANFARSLTCDLAEGAEALIVEPMIFGRAAMGETDLTGSLSDRICIRQNGEPLHLDAWTLTGNLTAQLDRPAIAGGARAMASLTYVGPRAEAHLDTLRALLPESGGASLKSPGLVTARLLTRDGYQLRQHLLPILDALTGHTLPTCWRL